MSARVANPLRWLSGRLPKSQSQLEMRFKGILKVVFWLAFLAPVIIVPAYYLLVTFGLLPPVRLPPG
ncbi:MAG TPA: hypothetical protein VJR06_00030 [Nitrososphaerales archaeon]|nr:hypothetical protein [Nitrososphaerales archaeon]